MKKEIAPELLEKYLRGECTDEELLQVYDWYDAFDDDDDLLSHLPVNEKEQLKKVLHKRIRADIDTDAAENGNGKVGYIRFPKSNIFYLVSVIAAIFIIAFGALIYIQNKSFTNQGPQWANRVTLRNTSQSYIKQTLPDGSTVWLSPRSVMEYPKKFDQDKRDVSMIGEAFFEVTKNPARPFTIYSGSVVTRVWGTSFKVNASAKSSFSEVAVLTGKVSVTIPPTYTQSVKNLFGVHDNTNQVMLLPYQQATYLKTAKTLQKAEITDRSIILCWKRTDVSFNNEPVKKVIEVLNSKFDVHITAADAGIEKYHIKADFNNQNLADILEVMHLSMNVAYIINNNQIELKRIQPN
ncbi:FecR family protein [Mucilaginibacter sp. AW1-3]